MCFGRGFLKLYNYEVKRFNNEIQVTRYFYPIAFSDNGDKPKKDVCLVDPTEFVPCTSEQLALFGLEPFSSDEVQKKYNIQNVARSTRRSVQGIYDICRSNVWTYFCTFTFLDNSIRYDYSVCRKKLSKFLDNFKQRQCSDMYYICVPEQHKDGAWHFHGLFSEHIKPFLKYSPFVKGSYILEKYKFGRTDFQKVKDTNRVSCYISKYITKDLATVLKGKQRYFYSKNCKKPEVFRVAYYDTFKNFMDTYFPDFEINHQKYCESSGYEVEYYQLGLK